MTLRNPSLPSWSLPGSINTPFTTRVSSTIKATYEPSQSRYPHYREKKNYSSKRTSNHSKQVPFHPLRTNPTEWSLYYRTTLANGSPHTPSRHSPNTAFSLPCLATNIPFAILRRSASDDVDVYSVNLTNRIVKLLLCLAIPESRLIFLACCHKPIPGSWDHAASVGTEPYHRCV
jgi:hypothetical protein